MVSIIIVAMGVDDELRACLASLRTHVRCAHELILVNNGTTPLGLAADTIIENGRNLGFARAVNRGIAAAHGEWILLLNPDAELTADIITPMVAFMEAHPQAGIGGVQLIFPDGRAQNSIDAIPTLFNQFINRALLKLLFPRAYPSKRSGFQEPVRVPSVIGACMLLRRSMLDAIGDLDEGFFLYLEETDLCRRATEHGWEIWHLPQLTLIHHQGVTARKFDIRRTLEFQRSMTRFFRKHQGPAAAGFFAVLSIIKAAVEVAGNLPLAFRPKPLNRMQRSAAVLAWTLLGMPEGRGLEPASPHYHTVHRNGYRWFVPTPDAVPPMHPDQIMHSLDEVLNDSRTTFVKRGRQDDRLIYFKRYNYKGLADTLKNLVRKSRALRAFEAALTLEALGVDTPHVLFACEKRIAGVLLASYIATEGLQAVDLVQYARQGIHPTDIIRVAHLIRRLHAMGVLHVDLKGENLLIDPSGRISLIDLDRLRRVRYLGLKRRAKNLSYLNASFATTIAPSDRLQFIDEYIKGDRFLEHNRDALIASIAELTQKRLKARYEL